MGFHCNPYNTTRIEQAMKVKKEERNTYVLRRSRIEGSLICCLILHMTVLYVDVHVILSECASLCVDIGSMWLEQWSPSGDRLVCLSRAAVLCAERLQTIRKWEVPYIAKFLRPKKFTNCI